MFGLSLEKILVVAVLVAIVVGPRRLPEYSRRIAELARNVRAFAESARAQATSEIGIDPEQWRALDPRRYDPRRIVADALKEPVLEPALPAAPAPVRAVAGTSGHPRRRIPPVSHDEASTAAETAPPTSSGVDTLEA